MKEREAVALINRTKTHTHMSEEILRYCSERSVQLTALLPTQIAPLSFRFPLRCRSRVYRPEQMMIYQVIEKAGNTGIWTRDIKTGTNVNQVNTGGLFGGGKRPLLRYAFRFCWQGGRTARFETRLAGFGVPRLRQQSAPVLVCALVSG